MSFSCHYLSPNHLLSDIRHRHVQPAVQVLSEVSQNECQRAWKQCTHNLHTQCKWLSNFTVKQHLLQQFWSLTERWFWSNIYPTLHHVKSQNCMMMMYNLHSTHSPCHIDWQRPHHRCQDGYHVDSADCGLTGIVLGVTMKKISPNNNTTQYLQILPSTQ